MIDLDQARPQWRWQAARKPPKFNQRLAHLLIGFGIKRRNGDQAGEITDSLDPDAPRSAMAAD